MIWIIITVIVSLGPNFDPYVPIAQRTKQVSVPIPWPTAQRPDRGSRAPDPVSPSRPLRGGR